MNTVSRKALSELIAISAEKVPEPDSFYAELMIELAVAGLLVVNEARHLALTARGRSLVERVLQTAEEVQRQGRD